MKFYKFLIFIIVLLLVLLIVWTALGRSKGPRNTSPEAGAGEVNELVRGNSEFAFDLYSNLVGELDTDGEKTENLFFSPYSISLGLAITRAGARGNTETQIRDTLHFNLEGDRFHPTFNALDLELESRGNNFLGLQRRDYHLDIANSLWGQDGYPFSSDCLDLIIENYDAELRYVDFERNPGVCATEINNWVAEYTEGMIQDMVPDGSINPVTTMAVVNAIYFKSDWDSQFDKSQTRVESFYLLDQTSVQAPMMHQSNEFPNILSEGFRAVELPYKGEELSMVILLPDFGEFEEFENELDADRLDEILGNFTICKTHLTLPRFDFTSEYKLKDTLTAMGMPDAFALPPADFSGLDPSRGIWVDEIFHKAYISVDEEGTVAGAGLTLIKMKSRSVRIDANRPFIFLIRDIETGTILFLGRILDPTALT